MFPGFAVDNKYCRGMEWTHGDVEEYDFAKPRDLLICVLNQLLSLATTGCWEKGFLSKYAGTIAENEVRAILPDIEAAVLSKSCSKGLAIAEKVCEKLNPLILEACKQTEREKILSDLASSLGNELPDWDPGGENMSSYDADEKAADNEDGNNGDFQLAEDDEEAPSPGSGFNIFDMPEMPSPGESGQETDENGNTADGGNSDSGESSSGDASSKNDGEDEKGKQSGSRGQHADKDADNDASEVLAAMLEAANEAKEASELAIASEDAHQQARAKVEETEDPSMPLDMSEICTTYNEFHRQYQLTEELPADIQAECDVLRREYEQYFISRTRPTRRGLRSGQIDPKAIYKAGMRQMELFKRRGDDDRFSGCIEIRIDNSGSMGGFKKQCAVTAAARLEEIFKGLVPLKITSFDLTENVNVEVIKNWEDSFKKNCCWNYLKYGRSGGGTPTTEALLTAKKELLNRSEENKLLILLTDENTGYEGEYLKSTIHDVRSSGIQLCGIYFEDYLDDATAASFESLFDNIDAIACMPEEITKNLLPIVKRFTKK